MFDIALRVGVVHPNRLLGVLNWSELNDLMALYEVQPWGERRADLRSFTNAAFVLGGDKCQLEVTFPYVPSDTEEISVEDEAEFIEYLKVENNAATGTNPTETDRVG